MGNSTENLNLGKSLSSPPPLSIYVLNLFGFTDNMRKKMYRDIKMFMLDISTKCNN